MNTATHSMEDKASEGDSSIDQVLSKELADSNWAMPTKPGSSAKDEATHSELIKSKATIEPEVSRQIDSEGQTDPGPEAFSELEKIKGAIEAAPITDENPAGVFEMRRSASSGSDEFAKMKRSSLEFRRKVHADFEKRKSEIVRDPDVQAAVKRNGLFKNLVDGSDSAKMPKAQASQAGEKPAKGRREEHRVMPTVQAPYPSQIEALEKRVKDSEAELHSTKKQLAKKTEEAAEMYDTIAAQEEHVAGLKASKEEMIQELRAMRRTHATCSIKSEAVADQQRTVSGLIEQVATLNKKLSSLTEDLEAEKSVSKDWDRTNMGLTEQLKELQARYEGLQQKLTEQASTALKYKAAAEKLLTYQELSQRTKGEMVETRAGLGGEDAAGNTDLVNEALKKTAGKPASGKHNWKHIAFLSVLAYTGPTALFLLRERMIWLAANQATIMGMAMGTSAASGLSLFG